MSNQKNVSNNHLTDKHTYALHRALSDGTIQNRTTKYSVHDAIVALNDGMNFLYCRPDEYYEQTMVVKDTFSIAIDGSMEIDEADLLTLMEDIAEFAGDAYYADMRSDKQPFMFSIDQVTGGGISFINIEAIFAWHAGLTSAAEDEYPYEDSWIYGQFNSDVSGFCSEEEFNADAADLFRRDLRANVAYRNKNEAYYFSNPYIACFSTAGGCYHEEIATFYFPIDITYDDMDLINPGDITQNDNLFDFLLFDQYPGYPNHNHCLATDEMNFYYESMEDLSFDLLPSPAGSLKIAQIEVGYDLIGGSSSIFQCMITVRATKNTITEPEHQDAEPLPCC